MWELDIAYIDSKWVLSTWRSISLKYVVDNSNPRLQVDLTPGFTENKRRLTTEWLGMGWCGQDIISLLERTWLDQLWYLLGQILAFGPDTLSKLGL